MRFLYEDQTNKTIADMNNIIMVHHMVMCKCESSNYAPMYLTSINSLSIY